jgi:hypothetical protein
MEPLDERRAAGQRLDGNFERHLAAQGLVARLIDDGHRPPANLALDHVAANTNRGINNARPPLHETRISTDDFRGAVSHYLCRDV